VTDGALHRTVGFVRRDRRCRYCQQPLAVELGPAARYCCLAHRQRAYEARQADVTTQLHRRIRSLQRQIAALERVLDHAAAANPHAAAAITDALRDETEAALARGRAAAAARGGRGTQEPSNPTTTRTRNDKINKN
jgi:hypothetical protein